MLQLSTRGKPIKSRKYGFYMALYSIYMAFICDFFGYIYETIYYKTHNMLYFKDLQISKSHKGKNMTF